MEEKVACNYSCTKF